MACNNILKSFSSFVANNFTFQPPSPSGYSISEKKENSDIVNFDINGKPLEKILMYYPSVDYFTYSVPKVSKRKNQYPIILLELINKKTFKLDNSNYKTIVFSHGNATDLGKFLPTLIDICIQYQCRLFCYDYSGYGCSKGKPSEKEIYDDMDIIMDYIMTTLKVKNNIFM